MWTFGRRIALGFALAFVLFIGIGSIAYLAVNALNSSVAWVVHSHAVLERIARMVTLLVDAETGERGYLITGDEAFLEPYQGALAAIAANVAALEKLTADNPEQLKRIAEVRALTDERLAHLKQGIESRRAQGVEGAAKTVQANLGKGKEIMDDIRRRAAEMEASERQLLAQREASADSSATAARSVILYGTLFCLIVISFIGVVITRSLVAQIGSAVARVQSSSTELQAAATQQASGTRESSTAMNEIATTISELLATSRQIADSARRVSQVAEETVSAARSGDQLVGRAHESIGAIKRQVDVIVAHMLDLGKRSQQIGGIVDLVGELAEQTNILAINASIEAAGAGDAGKRFGVVADEIRKLADRVGDSTKDIRGLIDDMRAAVNSTVMATESGTKTVDAGARQFGDVAAALNQIARLVGTTTEAAKEIELSTKQQSSAVEQVNVAIANVTKATKETETSSGQTLQTATQLSGLSGELDRLIRPSAA